MRGQRLCLFLGIVIVLSLLACSRPSAPTPSPTGGARTTASPTTAAKTTQAGAAASFAGKTITTIVPYSPGGGTDVAGRLYAQFLGKFLPGNPTVVVRNIPGGETIIGTNFAYASKPDGLTAFVGGGSVHMAELLDKPEKKFSLRNMPAVLGTPLSSVYIAKSNVVRKPEEVTSAKGMIFGHTTGASAVMFILGKEMIGIPTDKVITAYTGTGDARRAFLAGEINATNETAGAYDLIKPLVQKGEVTLLFQNGYFNEAGELLQSPIFPPEVLTTKGLYEKLNGKPPSGPVWEAYRSIAATRTVDKPLLLPPGTPDNIVSAYWDAAAKMAKDADFIKMSQVAYGEALWITGATFDKIYKREMQIKPEVRDWLSNLLGTKYGMALS